MLLNTIIVYSTPPYGPPLLGLKPPPGSRNRYHRRCLHLRIRPFLYIPNFFLRTVPVSAPTHWLTCAPFPFLWSILFVWFVAPLLSPLLNRAVTCWLRTYDKTFDLRSPPSWLKCRRVSVSITRVPRLRRVLIGLVNLSQVLSCGVVLFPPKQSPSSRCPPRFFTLFPAPPPFFNSTHWLLAFLRLSFVLPNMSPTLFFAHASFFDYVSWIVPFAGASLVFSRNPTPRVLFFNRVEPSLYDHPSVSSLHDGSVAFPAGLRFPLLLVLSGFFKIFS